MSLAAGTRLGPYEIVAPLGVGGMGEVYRAHDARLGRDVAVKVLPPALASDVDRLRRFEQEARAASALNHPNILAVFDVGEHGGVPFVVTELLEGETLRARIGAGALPPRKAIEYAIQLAAGIGAAHERGIVHRDLKPENVFLTSDGRVKILDFGLAKLTESRVAGMRATAAPTFAVDTAAGVVLGTVGYMSPEQVRGQPADHRTDIFSFGATLYEMLSGRRAFTGDSAAETMTAILREEPPELSETARLLPPGLEQIVRHCLEKSPDERFQSARDVAFNLRALSEITGGGAAAPSMRARRTWVTAVASAAGVMLAMVLAFVAGRATKPSEPPVFRQLTFRDGTIDAARFTPDGRSIVYSARWGAEPLQLFTTAPGSPESRPTGLTGTSLLSVSPAGELAISLNRRFLGAFIFTGMLARVPLAGSAAPREVLDDVQDADWAPDGEKFALIREVAGRQRLEFPIGHVLYETGGWLSSVRVSPGGDRVAFLEHPARGNDAGSAAVIDQSGKKTTLSVAFASVQGLAWAGDEVWFTGAPVSLRTVYAADRSGRVRPIARATGQLTLRDVAADGRALVTRDDLRLGILARAKGAPAERDLSWLDWSLVRDMSADGSIVLFDESGEGGGLRQGVYIRKLDGGPAVRLGDGVAMSLSPDGRFALSLRGVNQTGIVLLPTGAGSPVPLNPRDNGVELTIHQARFFPDGRRVALFASAGARPGKIYEMAIDGRLRRSISPEGVNVRGQFISPDGRSFVARPPEGANLAVYPVDGGPPRAIPGTTPDDAFVRWSGDGRSAFLFVRSGGPSPIYRIDVSSGQRAKFIDPTGEGSVVYGIQGLAMTADGSAYAYTYVRAQSDLYLVEGLK